MRFTSTGGQPEETDFALSPITRRSSLVQSAPMQHSSGPFVRSLLDLYNDVKDIAIMLDSRRTFLISSSLAAAAAMMPIAGRAAVAQPYAERWIPRGSNKLYARDYPGAGPAFVMLHGFPDNSQIYNDLAPILSAAGRRVITFDFLGYGKSDKPSGFAYSFEQQAEDVQIVADALDLQSFVMVPHDAGGPAGINYALSNPTRIASLAVLNGFFQPTPLLRFPELIQIFADPDLAPYASSLVANPSQLQSLLNFQMNAFQVNLTASQKARFDAVLQPIINDNFATGSGPAFVAMAADMRANAGYNTARVRLMRSFPKPVNFVWGTEDPYANLAVGEELASLFSRPSFTALPLGHWLQIDSPAAVARELLARN